METTFHTHFFQNVEVYLDNQQTYNSKVLYAHKSNNSNHFKRANSECQGVLHCEGYDGQESPDESMEAPLTELLFTRSMKMLSTTDGSKLYSKVEVKFFSTSEMLYRITKTRLRLIRSRPNFYMISDNPNVSLGIVDCSLFTPRIALKDDYLKKRMDMFV